MSKKLVSMLTIVMLLAFTFAANAGHKTGATSSDITSSQGTCATIGFITAGFSTILISTTGVGSIIAPIGGEIAGAAVGYACNELADWLEDNKKDDDRVKAFCPVGSKVYWQYNSVDGVGEVISICTIMNHILVKSDGDGKSRTIFYGWAAKSYSSFKAFTTYE